MQLENQVCSLDLAKRLKELGVKQESLFYWRVAAYDRVFLIMNEEVRDKLWSKRCFENLCETGECKINYSAFTVVELGEMLPKKVTYFRNEVTADVFEGRGSWPYYVELWQPDGKTIIENGATEADARAKMLVFLLKNNII